MPRVFVLQNHKFWDAAKQELADRFDFSPAEVFGKVGYLLSHSLSPFNPEAAIAALKKALDDVDFQEDDYLLLAGNPCLIAWAGALVADRTGGRLRLLQWHGKDRRYIEIDSSVWNDEDEYSDE